MRGFFNVEDFYENAQGWQLCGRMQLLFKNVLPAVLSTLARRAQHKVRGANKLTSVHSYVRASKSQQQLKRRMQAAARCPVYAGFANSSGSCSCACAGTPGCFCLCSH